MNPLISFVIPVYNRQEQIVRCINSILSSDFKDYEIILIDDASTDNTPDVCRGYAAKYSNIHYFSQSENKGPGAARNVGIDKAKGEFIYFVDSDDSIIAETLPEFAEVLRSNDNVDVFNVRYLYLAQSGERQERGALGLNAYYDIETISDFCINILTLQCWTFCFRLSYIRRSQITFTNAYYNEDTALVSAAVVNSKGVYFFPKPLYVYYAYGSYRLTESNSKFALRVEGLDALAKSYKLLLENYPSENYKKIIHFSYLYGIIYLAQRIDYTNLDIDDTADEYPFGIDECIENGALYCAANWVKSLYRVIDTATSGFSKRIYFCPAGKRSRRISQQIIDLGGKISGYLDNNPNFDAACVYDLSNFDPGEKDVIVLCADYSVHLELESQLSNQEYEDKAKVISIWDVGI